MIRIALIKDSKKIAYIHKEALSTSFLASLGYTFLNELYSFLIETENIWVYEECEEIKGFVSFAENSAGMMKRFLINCPYCILILIAKSIVQPTIIKKFFETFKAPFKTNDNLGTIILPSAELLSISVSPNCQSSGIGSKLVKELEDYLIQNNIPQYKVIAGEELIGANKFYLKNGFVLAAQISIHGNKKSNVYIKNIIQ